MTLNPQPSSLLPNTTSNHLPKRLPTLAMSSNGHREASSLEGHGARMEGFSPPGPTPENLINKVNSLESEIHGINSCLRETKDALQQSINDLSSWLGEFHDRLQENHDIMMRVLLTITNLNQTTNTENETRYHHLADNNAILDVRLYNFTIHHHGAPLCCVPIIEQGRLKYPDWFPSTVHEFSLLQETDHGMRQFFPSCCCVSLSNFYHSEAILDSLCSFYSVHALDREAAFMGLCSHVGIDARLFFPTFFQTSAKVLFLCVFSWAIGRSMMITDTMRHSNDDSFIPGVSFSIHFQFMESLIEYDACIGYGVQSGIGSLSGSSV